MEIAMMQLNPKVGDIGGNLNKALKELKRVHDRCDLAVFPELYLTGYPPRDLLEKPFFIDNVNSALNVLVKKTKEFDCGVIIGLPRSFEGPPPGLYNSALLLSGGKIIAEVPKSLLPFYDVFDETRYFTPNSRREVVGFRDSRIALTICEDMWAYQKLCPGNPYNLDPVSELAEKGVDLVINISASPFHVGKQTIRFELAKNHAERNGCPFIFLNQVGGNDELVFDGNSLALDAKGKLISQGKSFDEDIFFVETDEPGRKSFSAQHRIEAVHDALILGLRDYMKKCGFEKMILGLSGGIDSAVCCALAAEAVGPENVTVCSMPSKYTSSESLRLAREMASIIGITYHEIAINQIYSSYTNSLKDVLDIEKSDSSDVFLQNIQARIRGNILMAFSNKYNKLLISTGNKSELAVGYCTLYGDMAGGLALISDVPKSDVYALAEYINTFKPMIPLEIIERAPSAELAPDQKDTDTLPKYHILDKILYQYLEQHFSLKQIIASGMDLDTARWVLEAVNRNEYKRRQMPPGLKVTSKAFGMGRRMPIAANFDENEEV